MEAKRPFSELDWDRTPEPVKQYIYQLEQNIEQLINRIDQMEKRIAQLESKNNQNSSNSNKPPSSDSPFQKPIKEREKSKKKRGAQKGHKGHRQELLEPTNTIITMPEMCTCGCKNLIPKTIEPFYVHQHFEAPSMPLDITHVQLNKGLCAACGKVVHSAIPREFRFGYGPRLSALIAELSGIQGASREMVQNFCNSVLGIPISIGGIQRILDRTSEAILPHYDKIGQTARSQHVNHVDETSWFQNGKLKWLWVMVNASVAYFMVHSRRSKEAFLTLIDDWRGILVSDNYKVYVSWMNGRQSCLAHYIRRAKGLCEDKNESIKEFGELILKELRLLCMWAKSPPSKRKWNNFYSRFITLLFLYEGGDDKAGKFAKLLLREMDSLWLFLEENGVEPTNNCAERALRFGVIWRKRSYGTQSDKGNRWVERILSLKETCRKKKISSFNVIVDALSAYFKEQQPDLAWIG